MQDWLDDVVAGRATVLTVNQRLARSLRERVDADHLAAGDTAWQRPDIREWRGFLYSLYQQAVAEHRLPLRLGAHQSQLLWEDALRPDLADGVQNLGALARLARDTRDALVDHRVAPERVSSHAASDDQRVFSSALKRYLARLRNNDWTDDAGVREYLLSRASAFRWPPRLLLAGFAETTPYLAGLEAALTDLGVSVARVSDAAPGEVHLAAFADADAELRAAGRWARRQLEADAGRRIAIVVSGLDSDADYQSRLVREGFVPGWPLAGPALRRSVNVSYGRRLADYPMVAAAFHALRFAVSGGNSTDLSQLLRSRLIDGHEDDSRVQADLQLRELPDRDWSVSAVRVALEVPPDSALEAVLTRLDECRQRLGDGRRSPEHWAAEFEACLSALGWPGTASLDSEEFQLANRFRELLEEFSALSLVAGDVTVSAALTRLQALATETVFQPEQSDSLIDLLGPMEAAGQDFDAVWLAGMTATHWPGTARPSPLVAKELQREAGMRDCSPERRLQQQCRLLDQLVAAAPEVVVSYPRSDGDAELDVSPLLGRYAQRPATFDDPGWFAGVLAAPASLEAPTDRIPPVAVGERVYGGAGTVDRQAGCPFDAFASARLGISALEPFSRAIGPRIRGILTHAALCSLYRDISGREQLAATGADELAQRIERCVAQQARGYYRGADATLREMLRLEEARLTTLLRQFTALDLDRDAFDIVALEDPSTLTFGPVELRFKVDRIDRLSDGRVLVLDYKTGAVRTLLDSDGEPRSYQLIVYAMTRSEAIAGIGLYFVNRKRTELRGLGAGLGHDEQFNEKLTTWQARVRSYLERFADGDVRIVAQRPLADSADSLLISRLPELLRHV